MRKLALALVLSVFGSLCGPQASGEDRPTDDGLLVDCSEYLALIDGGGSPTEALIGMGQCYGLVEGVVGAHLLEAKTHACASSELAYCAPGEATFQQHIRVVDAYLKAHPADLHLPAIVLIYSAFAGAWPCAAPSSAVSGKSGPRPTCDLSTQSARLARQVKVVENPKEVTDCRFLGTVTGWEDTEKKNGGFQLATKAGAYAGGRAADVRVLHVEGGDDRTYLCGGAAK